MLSSELQEFRVYLTHHVTPRGKTLLRNSSLSSCPVPRLSSASSGEDRTTDCSHTFKGHTVMTTPEITVSIPHLVSSLQLEPRTSKEQGGALKRHLWQLQGANTALQACHASCPWHLAHIPGF